jgi:hypothetical protein
MDGSLKFAVELSPLLSVISRSDNGAIVDRSAGSERGREVELIGQIWMRTLWSVVGTLGVKPLQSLGRHRLAESR